MPDKVVREDILTPHSPLDGPPAELSINLHDGSDEQIAVIIVHKDRPEYLNILLQSITVMSNNNNYEVIIADNSTQKESFEFLDDIKDEPGIKIVRNNKNIFWSAAANKAVQQASKNAKYFIFLHCDVVILHPGWMDSLISVSESQKSGMVGIETGSYFMQGQKVEFVQEWCMLITRECFEDVGPWPETLPQIGHAFIMTMAAQQRQWKPQVMKNNIAHHYKIFALDVNQYEQMVEKCLSELSTMIQQIQSRPVNAVV